MMKIQSAYNSTPIEMKSNNLKITDQEKKFFAKMYPEQKTEVMNYHFYEKDGKLSGVKTGSLFDRKG